MIKSCPRCFRSFECRSDDIFKCECIGVPLSKKDLNWISANYEDCLCVDCLKEVNVMRMKDIMYNKFD